MNSIRRHLTIRLCLLAAILFLAGILSVYLLARQLLVSQFDATLAAKADALMAAAEVDGDEFEIDLDVQHFAGFGSPLTGDFFEVRHADGRVIARSPSLETRADTFARVPLIGEWRGKVVLPQGELGRAMAVSFVPEGDDTGRFGDLQLVVASESAGIAQTMRTLVLVLTLIGSIGLVVAILLIRAGLGKGLQPLGSLALEVESLKVHEAGLRVGTSLLPKELRGIGGKLNDLLARVEASIERERRFSSHAAHELRTPLAELKMMAEMAGKWPEEATLESSAEMVQIVREMEGLLDKLTLLSRAEAGGYALKLEEVDLAASIERAIESDAASIAARGLIIDTKVEPGSIKTDAILWQTILRNLVGNAVAYAPERTAIRLSASPEGITVLNRAPNLTSEDLNFLFERFWRKNTAREGENHSGLGLPIVQAAVQLLGGTCRANLVDGELQIRVEWRQQEIGS